MIVFNWLWIKALAGLLRVLPKNVDNQPPVIKLTEIKCSICTVVFVSKCLCNHGAQEWTIFPALANSINYRWSHFTRFFRNLSICGSMDDPTYLLQNKVNGRLKWVGNKTQTTYTRRPEINICIGKSPELYITVNSIFNFEFYPCVTN